VLLEQSLQALSGLGDLAGKPLFDGCGARETFRHCGELLAPRYDPLLNELEITAQFRQTLGGFRGLFFCGRAKTKRLGMPAARLLGARADGFCFGT
jgi:hypothetical protein